MTANPASEGQGAPHSTPSPFADFLSRYFDELDRSHVHYCVARNFAALPEQVDGDVDVLVRPGQRQRAEAALLNLLPGFFVFRRVERNDHLLIWIGLKQEFQCASRVERPARVLQLDLVTRLQWSGVPYLDTVAVLGTAKTQRGFWVASSVDEACHVLCHAILDKKVLKPGYRAVIQTAIAEHGEAAFAPLRRTLGVTLVRALYEAFTTWDDATLLALRPQVIRGLLGTRPTALSSFLRYHAAKGLRIARAILQPPGVLIATAGPDGVGKSTLLARTKLVLDDAYSPIVDQYMGWRDFTLPTKRLLTWLIERRKRRAERTAPPSAPSQRIADRAPEGPMPWTHNLSVLHYFIDLWARYLLQIRPQLARDGLVLCDRYFFDVLVQEVLVCENRILRRLLLALTPRPTVTALLSGDPKVIAARKSEMSAEKTARNMASLDVLRGRPGVLVLDAQKPVEENLEAVLRGIFPRWQ